MNKSLIVFKLTEEQRDMMLDSVMFAYEMDIEERNDYDSDTFQAMIDEVVGSYRWTTKKSSSATKAKPNNTQTPLLSSV